MRSPHTLVAFQLFAAMSLAACSCFVPVTEKQCDLKLPCGSGWVCVAGVCQPPDGGAGGGSAGGSGGGVAGGAGGGTGGFGGGNVCGGCRDAAGQCQPGNTSSRCGANGQTCKSCPSNQSCQNGNCVSAPCNATNCPQGCCRAGACVAVAMQGSQACGLSGMTCAACGLNESCFFGKCAVSSQCNAGNCSGCCSGNTCITSPFQTVTNCGSSGVACMACPAGQLCISGKCSMNPCSFSNCSQGCCRNGQCVPFTMQGSAACGAAGQECKSCPAPNTCGSGSCNPPPCNAATCSGCCGPGGCQPGTSQFACGKSGQACLACGSGQTCQAGACQQIQRKIGDPCQSDPECGAIGPGSYCKKQTSSGNGVYTNGFCTRPCSLDGGSGCTVDSVCLNALQPYGENDVFCSPRCTSMNQCRLPGYACYFINTVSTTACWLNPIPGGTVDAGMASFIGSACVNAGQCTNPSNSFCILDVLPSFGASGFVGGYCSALCSGVPCVAGSSCQSVTGFSSGITQQVCLRDCVMPRSGQSNCRNGYVCEGTTGAAVGACLPRCNNTGASCPAGTTCSAVTGYCN